MGGTGPRSREIRLRAPPPHARPRSPFLCQAFPGDRSPSPCPRCQRPPPWRRLHKDATDLSLDFHLIRSSGLVDGKHLYFAQTSQDSVGATRECPVIRTHGPRLPVKYLSGSQEPRHVGEHRRGRRGSHTPRPPPHFPAFPADAWTLRWAGRTAVPRQADRIQGGRAQVVGKGSVVGALGPGERGGMDLGDCSLSKLLGP